MVAAYPPGQNVGSWLMTHSLLRALVVKGHEVDVVLSTATGAPYVLDGVRVWPHVSKEDPFRHIASADVIVCHLEGGYRASVLGQTCGLPVVQIAHNTQGRALDIARRGGSNLLVCNSVQMAAQFADHAGRMVVVHPPVDPVEYATKPGDAITLINLSEDKGARVFYALADRFPDRKFLGVRGGYSDQVIEDHPNVEVIDHVPGYEMRERVYARTKVLLMPSAHESWGRTGVEAMCSGIPVIAHPTPGLHESLGSAGIFADRADVDSWETELRRLLDGRRWKAASRKATARALELDPAADLARWCEEIETLVRRTSSVRTRVARVG
jgi:glycosyltransferase involved in cell wall biosynthesis